MTALMHSTMDALEGVTAERDRLRAEVERLREALQALLSAPTWHDQDDENLDDEDRAAERLARAALKETSNE